MILTGDKRITGEKHVPVPISLPQISYGLPWVCTRPCPPRGDAADRPSWCRVLLYVMMEFEIATETSYLLTKKTGRKMCVIAVTHQET